LEFISKRMMIQRYDSQESKLILDFYKEEEFR